MPPRTIPGMQQCRIQRRQPRWRLRRVCLASLRGGCSCTQGHGPCRSCAFALRRSNRIQRNSEDAHRARKSGSHSGCWWTGSYGYSVRSQDGVKVAVLSSSAAKKDLALELGAHEYIDTSSVDASKRLQELGGAALILATTSHGKSVTPLTATLQPAGRMLLLSPSGPMEFNTNDLIMGTSSIQGWLTGNALDAEDTIDFAKTFGIKCMIERFAFEDPQKAVDHMTSGSVRFRGVLVFN